MEIVMKMISDLKEYKNNPRKNDQAVNAVANSIKEFGFKVPIVIDNNANIVCGHTRLKAAHKLGIKEVPCIVADDLTDDQVRAFRLADNKTSEIAEWDFDLLDFELDGIDLEMSAFGFDEEDNKPYEAFVNKFKPKLTTDDCYTPPKVYEAVKNWCIENYGLHGREVIRPFIPGGDYQSYKYPSGCVVIDNPPFSIAAEIIDFYNENNIDYFLFADNRTLFGAKDKCNYLVTASDIVYENGALVSTSFRTNLGNYLIDTAPILWKAIDDAQENASKELSKYSYPNSVITAALLSSLSGRGVEFKVKRGQAVAVSNIDGMKKIGKFLYGGGFILSEAAEEAYAKAKVYKKRIKIELSEREKMLQATLSQGGDDNGA